MFYDAVANDHGLPIDPLKALIAPRPIGWISSLSPDGVANLAPYSFFNLVADCPHYVMFSSQGRKDSLRNIEQTGEFVCNLATHHLKDALNVSSASVDSSVDEFELAGLEKEPSRLVAPPRVKAARAAFECHYDQTVHLPGHDVVQGGYAMIIGRIVGVFIADEFITDGRVRSADLQLLARLGYADYAVIDEVFRMKRPA